MQAEGTMLLFARREKEYMMRSERRSSYNRSPRGRRPRRGRGYAYGVFALIVSILVWPVGMLLLWTRKLRWGGGVKFLCSLLTLVLCLCWIGWALTVQTDDWRITSTQDKVNTFLADAADTVSTRLSDAADDVAAASSDAYAYARVKLSDGILAGVSLADDAKSWVSSKFAGGSPDAPEGTSGASLAPDASPGASVSPEASLTPDPTATPAPSPTQMTAPTGFMGSGGTVKPTATASAEPTPTTAPTATVAPSATPTVKPSATPTAEPTKTPDASVDAGKIEKQVDLIGKSVASFAAGIQDVADTEEPTQEPTATPTAEPTATPTAEPTATPTTEPTATPTAEPTATPTVEPTATPTAAPTAEPTATPTEESTAEPTMLFTPAPAQQTAAPTALDIEAEPTPAPTLKPAGLAIVYHTSNGVGYHVRSKCVGMSSAKPYTLAESVAAGYHACGNCHPADESLLTTEEPVVWVDEDNVYHTSDECAEFEGQYKLMTLKDAYEKGATPCVVCGAASYAYVPEETAQSTATPTPTPTAEPTATATPAAEVQATANWMDAALSPALKPAGEAIVYHTSNGRAYHVASTCVGMSGAKPYTLAACVADGFRPCGYCDPPAASLLDEDCAWVDETDICHVSDECEYFEGQFELVALTEAVSRGLEGCPFCGMNDLMREYGEKRAAEEAALMELAKSVTVYYNDNSRYYHSADSCVNMPSADAHTLYDALEKGLRRCSRCDPPTLDDLRDQLETGEGN